MFKTEVRNAIEKLEKMFDQINGLFSSLFRIEKKLDNINNDIHEKYYKEAKLEEIIECQSRIIEDLIGIHGKHKDCEFFAIKNYRDKHPYVYHNGELVSKDNMKKCWITWEAGEITEIEVDT